MILGLLRIDVSFSSLWFSTVEFIPFAHQSSTINLAMSLNSMPNNCSAFKTDERCKPSSSSEDEETFHLASSTRLQTLPQQDTERTHIEPRSHESTCEMAIQMQTSPPILVASAAENSALDSAVKELLIKSLGNSTHAREVVEPLLISGSKLQILLDNDSELHCFVEISPSRLPPEIKRDGQLALPLFSQLFLRALNIKSTTSHVLSSAFSDVFKLARFITARKPLNYSVPF